MGVHCSWDAALIGGSVLPTALGMVDSAVGVMHPSVSMGHVVLKAHVVRCGWYTEEIRFSSVSKGFEGGSHSDKPR